MSMVPRAWGTVDICRFFWNWFLRNIQHECRYCNLVEHSDSPALHIGRWYVKVLHKYLKLIQNKKLGVHGAPVSPITTTSYFSEFAGPQLQSPVSAENIGSIRIGTIWHTGLFGLIVTITVAMTVAMCRLRNRLLHTIKQQERQIERHAMLLAEHNHRAGEVRHLWWNHPIWLCGDLITKWLQDCMMMVIHYKVDGMHNGGNLSVLWRWTGGMDLS